MRSVIQLSLLVMVVMFTMSCKKDEPNNNNENPPVKCRLTGMYADGEYSKILYDLNGLVSKMEFFETNQDSAYEYVIFKYDSEDRMIKAEYYNKDGIFTFDSLTYQAFKFTFDGYDYDNGGWYHFDHEEFELNKYGEIEKITDFDKDTSGYFNIENYYYLYEWEGNNLISEEHWTDDTTNKLNKNKLMKFLSKHRVFQPKAASCYNSKGEFINTNTTEYFYDNLKNPFRELSMLLYPDLKSMNNILSDTTYYLDDSKVYTTYTYEYNEYGFPTSCLMKREGIHNGTPVNYTEHWEAEYECN